jgi:Sulfotransferase domain
VSDRWPNLFIPGVEKGGTASLWQYLDAHPDVFMSKVKEPSFFTTDRHEAAKTEGSYLSLFEGRWERWRGEASVKYFYDELAPGRIDGTVPGARILIILRNPVERAYSAYWGTVRSGYERRSFREAVEIELAGGPAFDAENPRKAYVRRSYYREPVERFLSTFGERVRVLFLEELREDPRGEMGAVYAFLGIDPAVADRIEVDVHNTFWAPRNRLVELAMSSVRARRIARAIVPDAVHARLDRYVTVRGQKPELDEDVRQRLEVLFEAERPALESLLSRRLPW